MDVTGREAFVRGFLRRCAEEGLTKEAVALRIDAAVRVKSADGPGWLANSVGTVVGLPIIAGLLGGGALGYGAARLSEPDITPERVQAEELANTYKIYAQRAAAKKKMRAYRPTYATSVSKDA